jgi:hypothetical protein
MEPMPSRWRSRTAIPARFGVERERVLDILTRWEESTRPVSLGRSAFRPRESQGGDHVRSR